MVEPDHSFTVPDDQRSISYGPQDLDADTWILRVGTQEGERVELVLGKGAMYELWTEVHDVPWPDSRTRTGKLRREIVERIERADAETLHDVLRLLPGDD